MYAMLTVFLLAAAFFLHKKFPFLEGKTFWNIIIFILLSTFAGRTLGVYSVIPYWDKILHFLSGFILFSVGKQIYLKLGGKNLTAFFALMFAIAAAGVWEIYEFSVDFLLGLNSQNGSLSDTMLDIISGSASAVISLLVYKKSKNYKDFSV